MLKDSACDRGLTRTARVRYDWTRPQLTREFSCRYAGDAEGKGGIYNFVTKRGLCHGKGAKISWTQVSIFVYLHQFMLLCDPVMSCVIQSHCVHAKISEGEQPAAHWRVYWANVRIACGSR